MIDKIGRLKLTAPPEIIANIFDENIGYWTEVDVPAVRVDIDYTDEYIDIVDLDDDEDVYVYKATDALVQDFILDFEFEAINTWTGAGMIGIGLADSIGTMEDVANGLFATLYHSGANDNRITCSHMTSGTPVGGSNITALLDDTRYYGRLIRRGSYCWLGIYSDRIRETHHAGSPIEYRDTTPIAFTHFYPMSNFDSGAAGQAADARIHAVKLISAPDIDKYLRPGEGGTNSAVAAIQADLDNATDGLGALKALIDAVDALVSPAEIIANIFDIDMGYWTEEDVPGRVLIDYTNERIAITDLDGDEDVYVYKATDASVQDFILDFEFQVLSTTTAVGATSGFGVGLSGGATPIGAMQTATNGLYVKIWYQGVNDSRAVIRHKSGVSSNQSASINDLADDTTYYARLLRRGNYCWLAIYSDRARETPIAGSPVEYKDTSTDTYTNLYPVTAYNDGGAGDAMDAYVERIKLVSAPDIDKYLGRHVE